MDHFSPACKPTLNCVDGVVRAEGWRQALGPFAEPITRTLWTTTARSTRANAPATRLTQCRKRAAKGIPTPPLANPPSAARNCAPAASPFNGKKFARLDRFDPIAQARRAHSQRQQAAAQKCWNSSDKPEWLDDKAYRGRILARLAEVAVTAVMSALAVSEPYATSIRAGRRIPHPRHWLSLARLVDVSEGGSESLILWLYRDLTGFVRIVFRCDSRVDAKNRNVCQIAVPHHAGPLPQSIRIVWPLGVRIKAQNPCSTSNRMIRKAFPSGMWKSCRP